MKIIKKPTKTISGITPVAVMLPPRPCEHGSCIYCPNLNVPQSYTPKSPVVLRASALNYDPYKQVKIRIKAFKGMNHPTEKIELIVMGGTFLEYPKNFQYEFITGLYEALNGKKLPKHSAKKGTLSSAKTLKQAQKINETAKHRAVALCIETRPDVCIQYINRMREWGVTRIELGVQIIDDKIYEDVKRGHTVKDVIKATKALKDAGFKIGYHIMPGLPGSSIKKDIKLFEKIFSNSNFKPDQVKLYPCQVMPSSVLEKRYWNKEYLPYTKEQTEKVLLEMIKIVPRYARIMRVMREIPVEYLVAGTIRIDLRNEIENELRKKKSKLKEIRYREIGFALQRGEVDSNLKLKTTKYKASKGTEYFLEIINKDDILFGLLRLRLSKAGAIVREIHVYGQSLKLKEKFLFNPQKGTPKYFSKKYLQGAQHKGLGKWLMSEAEKITKKNKFKKLKVISGIGVREYYKNLNYKLEDTYMVKLL